MKQAIGLCLAIMLTTGTLRAQEKTPMKDAETPKTITGGCHCGAARYEVKGKIVRQSYCDCRACQLTTGTLKVPFVTVPQSTFKLTGKVTAYRSDSGVKCDAHGIWHFCPTCGTPVFWKPHKGDEMDILAGTLDDTKLFKAKDK
jgi:hypothetical protein